MCYHLRLLRRAIKLIQSQPRRARRVRVQFSRKPLKKARVLLTVEDADDGIVDGKFYGARLEVDGVPRTPAAPQTAAKSEGGVVGCGAWQVKGQRATQEDAFVLKHLKSQTKELYVAGVFDGHCGSEASHHLAAELPVMFARAVRTAGKAGGITVPALKDCLTTAWTSACDTYLNACTDPEACMAEWDRREGRVKAWISSDDLYAGSTGAVVLVSEEFETAFVLNCGDSRTVMAARVAEGWVLEHSSRDHTPEDALEQERLTKGRAEGRGYSLPVCGLGGWRLNVGEYQYAVSRSLEGPMATAKGIVSVPDVEVIDLPSHLDDVYKRIVCVASDGLWGVLEQGTVMAFLGKLREEGFEAEEAAEELCKRALAAGTKDNVTCVVLYL